MPSGGANKFSYENVKDIFESHGFKLLSQEYKTNNTKMDAICACGEITAIRLSDVQYGRKCQKCKAKKSSEHNRTPEDDIAKLCDDHNCRFIRSWIENKKTRIEYVCKCGRVAEAQLCNFKRFPNCWECGKLKKSGENCYMYDPDREAVAMRKRFRKMCGQHIHRFMKATGQKKTRRTHELLGYRPIDLQNHILNHPDYKLCIGNEWHVDHYFPIQAFLDHNILDLKIINRLDNLRPMLGPENLQKADAYDEKEFAEWLQLSKNK